MAEAQGTGTSPTPSTGPPSGPATRDEAELHEEAHRLIEEGIRILEGSRERAVHEARRIAMDLETVLVVEPAANPESSEHPAEALRLALRDTVVFENRRIARVIAGRITRMETPGRTPAAAASTPPARLEVDLETQEDRRTVQLEDAWAWNLHTSGAKEGDVVQIDREHPLVTLRDDAEIPDGRVLDERDHRIQIPLGALDRAHSAPLPEAHEGEDPDEAVLSRAARSPPRLLATGERTPTGPQAREKTDTWVRRRLSERHTRLLPGVLLVLDAAGLPERAAGALRASRFATVAPWVLLHEAESDRVQGLERRWRKSPGPR